MIALRDFHAIVVVLLALDSLSGCIATSPNVHPKYQPPPMDAPAAAIAVGEHGPAWSVGGAMSPFREAQMYFDAARRFDHARDFVSARDQYWKALVQAQQARADSRIVSMLMYNYGRTSGYTCHIEDAEKYLLESLYLEKQVTGSQSVTSSMRLFELARFYFDQDKFQQSAQYYSLGIAAADSLGAQKSEPIDYADALDEYANALSRSGRVDEASGITDKATYIRYEHVGARRQFIATRYNCQS